MLDVLAVVPPALADPLADTPALADPLADAPALADPLADALLDALGDVLLDGLGDVLLAVDALGEALPDVAGDVLLVVVDGALHAATIAKIIPNNTKRICRCMLDSPFDGFEATFACGPSVYTRISTSRATPLVLLWVQQPRLRPLLPSRVVRVPWHDDLRAWRISFDQLPHARRSRQPVEMRWVVD